MFIIILLLLLNDDDDDGFRKRVMEVFGKFNKRKKRNVFFIDLTLVSTHKYVFQFLGRYKFQNNLFFKHF